MAISCRVLFPNSTFVVFDFEEVPRSSDYILIPDAADRAMRFHVGSVYFAATGLSPQSVTLQVTGAALNADTVINAKPVDAVPSLS